MALPALYVYDVTSTQFLLAWSADDPSDNVKFSLYGAATFNGTYTAVPGFQKMGNHADHRTPGSNLAIVNRSTLGIGPKDPYCFKLTSINAAGTETFVVDSPFINVDALDDFFRNRRDDNRNAVYKNITVGVGSGDTSKLIPIAQILGREANYIRMLSTADCLVAFNDALNDNITLKANTLYEFWKDSIVVQNAYFSFVSATASVEVFISGN